MNLAVTNLTEDTSATLPNPERGFFQYTETHYNSDGTGYTPLSVSTVASDRVTNGHTVLFRYFYLEKYRTADTIDATYLALLAADLAAARAAGVKLVIRFAYANSGTTPPYNSDTTPTRVVGHIQQLAPTLNSYADVIYAVEAGFIGTWGEWYYSDNFTADPATPWLLSTQNWTDRQSVLTALLDGLDRRMFVLVRYPGIKLRIFGAAPTDPRAGRVGFHNDAFLASDDDFGTYSTFTTLDVAGTRAYVAAQTAAVPMGGESAALNPPRSDWPTAATELAGFHWSFLNPIYQPDVLASWGSSGQNEAARNLGYRLVGTQVRVSTTAAAGSVLRFELDVTSAGYTPPMQARDVLVVLDDQAGHRQDHALPLDVRTLASGRYTLSADVPVAGTLPSGSYRVGLWLPDTSATIRGRPEYAIRLANVGTWNATAGYNDLTSVTITGGVLVGLSPQHLTLTANTVATVTLDSNYGAVEVLNVDGSAAVYVSNNGTDPTVSGDGFHVLPAAVCSLLVQDLTSGNTVVKLISAGGPRVSVRGL